jgi:TetR/AcrR family transcriptional regulator, lmrAB and yxaGH operons repressor
VVKQNEHSVQLKYLRAFKKYQVENVPNVRYILNMRKALKSKAELLQILMAEFRKAGFDGLSLSQIAKATGLGKASLYHHFPGGKDQMAQEVLRLTGQWLQSEIVHVLHSEGPAKERLNTVLSRLDSLYQSGDEACLLEMMIAGVTPESVRCIVADIFTALLKGFQKIALDLGKSPAQARTIAENAVISIQGSLILSRALNDTNPFRRQIKTIQSSFLN